MKEKGEESIIKRIEYMLLAFLFILTMSPSFLWQTHLTFYLSILFPLSVFIINPKLDKSNAVPIFFVTVLLMYNLRESFLYFALRFFVIFILISSYESRKKIYSYSHSFLAFFLLISLLVYGLVVVLGIELPYVIVDPSNEAKDDLGVFYHQYPFLTVSYYYGIASPRFASMFDEPGVVGTIATLFLFAERYKMNKWQNIVFLLSGLFSLSLFFIGMALIFIPFFMIKEKVQFKYVLLFFGMIVGLILFAVSYIDIDFEELVLNRLSNDDGGIVQDNRSTDYFDSVFSRFMNGDIMLVLFGKGINAHLQIDPAIQSYKMIIYDNGLLYLIITLLAFLVMAYKKLWKYSIILFFAYVLLFFAEYYNRPSFILTPAHLFLLFTIPQLLKETNIVNISKRKQNNFIDTSK